MLSASGVGTDLKVVGSRLGGSNCIVSMVVKDNHTAVSCFWAAMQTTSSNGAVGRVMRVTSVGRAVIALNNSLRAYEIKPCRVYD